MEEKKSVRKTYNITATACYGRLPEYIIVRGWVPKTITHHYEQSVRLLGKKNRTCT